MCLCLFYCVWLVWQFTLLRASGDIHGVGWGKKCLRVTLKFITGLRPACWGFARVAPDFSSCRFELSGVLAVRRETPLSSLGGIEYGRIRERGAAEHR